MTNQVTSIEQSKRLLELGVPADVAADHVHRFREHDEALLREQYLVYDDDAAVMQSARQARDDLLQLFEADSGGIDRKPPQD